MSNNVKSYIDNLIQDVLASENDAEIEKLKTDNEDIYSLLLILRPKNETEILAYNTLSYVLADNLKRIAKLSINIELESKI